MGVGDHLSRVLYEGRIKRHLPYYRYDDFISNIEKYRKRVNIAYDVFIQKYKTSHFYVNKELEIIIEDVLCGDPHKFTSGLGRYKALITTLKLQNERE